MGKESPCDRPGAIPDHGHLRKTISSATGPICLTKTGIPPASEMLARAFADDPMLSHLVPNAVKRRRVALGSFRCVLRYGILYGEVQATSTNLEGVAIWLPPEAVRASVLQMLRAGLLFSAADGWAKVRQAVPLLHQHLDRLHRILHAVRPLVLAVAGCRSPAPTLRPRHGPYDVHAGPTRPRKTTLLS